THTLRILLVDDNEPDIDLFKLAMKKANVPLECTVIRDGEELIKYLKKASPFEKATIPDLILLDINMPRMNGIEALKLIKNDQSLKIIPIVMLTVSDKEEDI